MPAAYGNQEAEPHAFDNANATEVPARMTAISTYNANSYCVSDVRITDGDLLMGGSQMFSQKSCAPNTGNVGNYYDWVAAVAGDNVSSGEARDSVCPRGWQLPNNKAYTEDKSFGKMINAYTGLTKSVNEEWGDDARYYVNIMAKSPFPHAYMGYYYYSAPEPRHRGSIGRYSTSTVSSETDNEFLNIGTDFLQFSNMSAEKGRGYAVRCVAR